MAELFSRYESGVQFTAGILVGSSMGVSGMNPVVDRLNSVAPAGSMISGTNVNIFSATVQGTTISGTNHYGTLVSGTNVYGTTLSGGNLRITNVYGVTLISGTTLYGTNISGTGIRGANMNAVTTISGPTLIGNYISGNNLRISNIIKMIGSPSSTEDVGTKNYIDTEILGISGINVTSAIAGEGINVSAATGNVTFSAEDATTSNKGVASFNTNDFTTSVGAVSLKNKTSYVSIPGAAFKPTFTQDSNNPTFSINMSGTYKDFGWVKSISSIQVPHNTIMTAAVVYGEGPTGWQLFRKEIDSKVFSEVGSESIGTEDSSLSNNTVDNNSYGYYFYMGDLNAGSIFGARITYTTDYD